jgi:hypothetical protein
VFVQQSTRVHFFLYGAIGILVCVIVGYFASLILPGERKPLEGLTIHTLVPPPAGRIAADVACAS